VRDGIAELALVGGTETWSDAAAAESSEPYQRRYRELAEAADYNEAYRRKLFKRWSTGRELRLLRRLLESQGRSSTLLDVPSGGGRLSSRLEPYTDRLIEADIARGQLLYARRNSRPRVETHWMTASAFHLPFRDGSVDGTVCCRLNHHLPTAEERERLVRELLRVSERFAIMTFFDHHSVKNLLRRARRPVDGKPPKLTMTVRQVAELAHGCGAELEMCPALAFFSSGHRYALMVKKATANES
jgi:SAM-dependent methyltransferase